MLDHVLTVARFNATLLEKMTADLPDADLTRQPLNLPNHPAWILGHLTVVYGNIGRILGLPVPFPESYPTLFSRETVPSNDRAHYPPKAELLTAFRQVHTATVDALARASPDQPAAPNPVEPLRPFFPTLGDLLVAGLTSHHALHLGQLSDWRRANGYPRIL